MTRIRPHGSFELIDPEFDEDDAALTLLSHEIATGAITLHPDGDSRNAQMPDPVPLHCRGYDKDDYLNRIKVDWDRYLKDRMRWEQEEAEREARYQEHFDKVIKEQFEERSKPKPPPPPHQKLPPAPLPDPIYTNLTSGWNYNPRRPRPEVDEHGTLIFNMRLEDPLTKGQGRVWTGYVMIRLEDFQAWQADRERRQMVEVCRGHGYVIFRRY